MMAKRSIPKKVPARQADPEPIPYSNGPVELLVRRELTRLKKEKNIMVPNLALRVGTILGTEFMKMRSNATDAAKLCIDFTNKMRAYNVRI